MALSVSHVSAGRFSRRDNRALSGHLHCGIDGVFEIVRVVSRALVCIGEVHAIVTGAHLA